MEKLIYKRDKFIASLNALQRSIKVFSYKDIPEDVRENLVASVIKHYEMCYESAWKFLKLYLEKRYDQHIDSPKKVFRQCYISELLDEETTKELLAISEARNSTSHDYNQENAQETCKLIESYYKTFKVLEMIPLEF